MHVSDLGQTFNHKLLNFISYKTLYFKAKFHEGIHDFYIKKWISFHNE